MSRSLAASVLDHPKPHHLIVCESHQRCRTSIIPHLLAECVARGLTGQPFDRMVVITGDRIVRCCCVHEEAQIKAGATMDWVVHVAPAE